MRNLFLRIFLFHLLVIGIFVLGLALGLDLTAAISQSRGAFALVLSAAILLALVLSVAAARNVVSPLESLYRRIKSFPAPASSLLLRSSVHELDTVARELDSLLYRLSAELAGHKIEKELLASLLDTLRDGALCLNREGVIIFRNRALHPDLAAEDSTGKSYIEAIRNSALLELVHEMVRQRNEQGQTQAMQLELSLRQRSFHVEGYPVRVEPEADLLLILVQDRTQESNARRLREDFLQNASHELKTPITSIRGYAETLAAREERETQRGFLVGILRNVVRMEAIIEDMVTISSLESRSFPFEPQRLAAAEYTQHIATLVQGALEQKKQRLRLEGEAGLELEADPLLMEHLLVNLISNASRYGPENSEIIVRYKLNANGDCAIFEVEDSGPGVPPELREKIFERFFRVDRDRSRVQGGTGLGLSIVRQISRLHSGNVAALAAAGGGALFRATLPLQQRNAKGPSVTAIRAPF
ncbi:MAG: sensor histidine kinase [Leptospirales bacterium]|nr:sensor histidine kinase [Leptospirales bacterium]